MDVQDASDKIIALLDSLSRDLSRAKYRELLEELLCDLEAREQGLDADDANLNSDLRSDC